MTFINDFANSLLSNVKLFATDTSLFSVDISGSPRKLNGDLKKISDTSMGFCIRKSVSVLILASKLKEFFSVENKKTHPPFVFNKSNISRGYSRKHLGFISDFKSTFKEHLNNLLNKINKTIGILRKLRNSLLSQALITIYKTFVTPHLDYGDDLFDKRFDNSPNGKRRLV